MPDPALSGFYYLAALMAGYLLGSIPFGLILTRLGGTEDLRQLGSGNIGATNVLRTGRKGLAATTLLLDGLKGATAAWLGLTYGMDMAALAGFGAVLGHLYPVWLKGRGGKGVATGLGVMAGLSPWTALGAAALWLAMTLVFRFSSLAALTAFAALPILAWYLADFRIFQLALAVSALVWWRHRANLARLLSGTEPRIGGKPRQER